MTTGSKRGRKWVATYHVDGGLYHMEAQNCGAWSNLRLILAQRNLSVLDLRKTLQKRGVSVNVKSLYRLTEPAPLWKIDTRIVNAICQTFDLELGDLIQLEKPTKELKRLAAERQQRLDALMEKNNAGELTRPEGAALTRLVEESQRISLHNARVLVEQKREKARKTGERKRAALID
jgi:DNA-binding Xre family transcriptional regulator